MSLFKKCNEFTRADDIKELGLYPYFRPIEANEGPVVQIEGKRVVMAGSNNYLGLTAHPKVKEAAIKAIEKYGTGCSGSRYLTGTLDMHIELEEKMAKFFNAEAVLLYSTGFQTALGVLPTLVQKGDYIISDKDNHACIVTGNLIAKGSMVEMVRYKHNDMHDLEKKIAKLPLEAGKLIVSDGVFSTGGEIVDLPKLNEVAKKYNAQILIDDAHSVGVIGKGGRGTASEFGLEKEIDLGMGTFSKTFASLGGFVYGPERVINYLKHHSPALIFSASPTPASVAAALAALEILEAEPERVTRLISNANYVRTKLRDAGFTVTDGRTAIVPVIVGDDALAFKMWRMLYDSGVFVNVFISPGVPPGRQMMRTSYMSSHEPEHLDYIIDTFKKIGSEIGLI
ncbi:MAG: pyridoxal phosphate-dependent aminotransferase family protein [Ignavibacteriales bacterium]|mgnify:CR=1 FL=1|nr:pyridoxal phosphate-dependent aminotransferase family protein [Ignavibacteriales bacterium]MBK7266387.1 pyridoxal phosphate-dependent aminotransferase family protein [Ignavibacteriales bacterium]MBK8661917.1 pyridoxal phosphate-dependent aminotransferase family protein [Ignavibacteriales bacterium]MBP9123701.1 pyridoxal phosphate-dependent aminotransferase family protein [Ignavibacteriaceae bacterium]MCC6636741.1 pyridoxal phosphate-dependent aminotransferase family protein [Ignavibacteriace